LAFGVSAHWRPEASWWNRRAVPLGGSLELEDGLLKHEQKAKSQFNNAQKAKIQFNSAQKAKIQFNNAQKAKSQFNNALSILTLNLPKSHK
jgi:hypothetical protein